MQGCLAEILEWGRFSPDKGTSYNMGMVKSEWDIIRLCSPRNGVNCTRPTCTTCISSCTGSVSFLWHCRALKEPLVEKECWQRAMRGLEGSDWQHNKGCFERYAEASLGFAQACLAQALLPNESPAHLLSSARLHLNRVVKHSHESFAETEQFSQLKDQLAVVNAAREQLL